MRVLSRADCSCVTALAHVSHLASMVTNIVQHAGLNALSQVKVVVKHSPFLRVFGLAKVGALLLVDLEFVVVILVNRRFHSFKKILANCCGCVHHNLIN